MAAVPPSEVRDALLQYLFRELPKVMGTSKIYDSGAADLKSLGPIRRLLHATSDRRHQLQSVVDGGPFPVHRAARGEVREGAGPA
jgi:hypothetical protein